MYRKDLSDANDISLCHIYRKFYMANLLEISRGTPTPKILVLSAANDISLCHIYRKDLSAANDISLCHIYSKVYMANLVEISRKIPPPKILVLTRCQRYLFTPYVQERFICCQRYLSVPYLQARFIWPIYADVSLDTSN